MADSDRADARLAAIANRISLSAVALAIAAFVVSFFQLLLGNLISSTARWKTNQAAIGIAARRRLWRPSSSKVKIYYPQIDFRYSAILAAAFDAERFNIKRCDALFSLRARDNVGWSTIMADDLLPSNAISDGLDVLRVTSGTSGLPTKPPFLTTADLPWLGRLRYMKWRATHPTVPQSRPRATWAQLIRAAAITDTSSIVLRHLDADSIPSSIDVPIQRARLFDIGCLALILGFDSIKIDSANRDFTAVSRYGTITTEEIPTFGKVIRFEGDIYGIYGDRGRNMVGWTGGAMCLAVGKIDVGCFNGDCITMFLIRQALTTGKNIDGRKLSFDKLSQAVIEGWGFEEYHAVNEAFVSESPDKISIRESFTRERNIFCQPSLRTSSQDILVNAAEWQAKTGLRIPTILAAATFMGVSPIACGFPSSATLNPFMPWYRQEALSLSGALQQPGTEGSIASRTRALLDCQFLRCGSSYLMSHSIPATSFGFTGWGFGNLSVLYRKLPREVMGILVSPGSSTNNRISIKIPLIPEVARLIEEYDPSKWAKEVTTARILHKGLLLRPENLLWIQVVVVDIAIRLHIRGSLEDMDRADFPPSKKIEEEGRWSHTERNVLTAIVKSWNPSTASNVPPSPTTTTASGTASAASSTTTLPQSAPVLEPWDLEPALTQHAQINFGGSDHESALQYKRLAVFLKLRALLLTAYLAVGPDSSDVFLSQDYDTQMPLV
ncbi:hypothetical protein BJY00DRAFT_310263 [Aspergillus carlsbadensis]|nr:hypothetical protein BJY00DRAFT_310263 [Aspergillus carlsbadensis]